MAKIKIGKNYNISHFLNYTKSSISKFDGEYLYIDCEQSLLDEALNNYNHQEYLDELKIKQDKQKELEKDIDVGNKIVSEVFNTNPYAQLSLIRKSIWALAVLNDNIEGDKEIAQEIINLSKLKDNEIQNILDIEYL